MSAAVISQAEARRLKKRVAELEAREEKRFAAWHTPGYPGGLPLAVRKVDTEDWMFARLQTARRLGCALVVTIADDGTVSYYAVKR